MAAKNGFVYRSARGVRQYVVRGTKNMYAVSLSDAGHTCRNRETDETCPGNALGKRQEFGPIVSRDPQEPVEWCKHVRFALANLLGSRRSLPAIRLASR